MLFFGNTYGIIGDKEVQDEMSNVGEVIKERRLAKGMSKRALAEKAGISHSEVHRIENGELTECRLCLCSLRWRDALGIPQDDILMLAGYKTDGESTPLIERVFPDLKTPKQQETAQKIVDGLSRNSDLKDSQYDELVRQVEMYLDYAKKNPDTLIIRGMLMQGNEPIGYYASWKLTGCLLILGKSRLLSRMFIFANGRC